MALNMKENNAKHNITMEFSPKICMPTYDDEKR